MNRTSAAAVNFGGKFFRQVKTTDIQFTCQVYLYIRTCIVTKIYAIVRTLLFRNANWLSEKWNNATKEFLSVFSRLSTILKCDRWTYKRSVGIAVPISHCACFRIRACDKNCQSGLESARQCLSKPFRTYLQTCIATESAGDNLR